jgi:hypothetical protein
MDFDDEDENEQERVIEAQYVLIEWLLNRLLHERKDSDASHNCELRRRKMCLVSDNGRRRAGQL